MKTNRERPRNRVWNVPIALRDTSYVWVSDEYRGYGSKRGFRKLDTVVDSFLRGYRVNGFTGRFKMRVHWLAGPLKNMVHTLVITCDGHRAHPPKD